MGCGRVGTTLAKAIEDRGHTLAIIDNNTESFRRLYKNFQGQKLTGEGYDRNTQLQAGIEDAYAFAAVADDDNANILAARMAREIYHVKKVVARISDPRRAEVYERLGIPCRFGGIAPPHYCWRESCRYPGCRIYRGTPDI
ncbi:Trk system potassium uptake protein trkA [Mobiluncus curtisii]|uniref:Trk system potassium uptake protein trkA n=2 Tax=Mobiluncus curtisii TaxID=2051 RepID=A0A2X3BAU6_9ACTO|nr:Trk system potassium uptake protein trkA [Mobiluncus curtisii]